MRSQETFRLATSYYLLLHDIRGVLLSEHLLDQQKLAVLPRHLRGAHRTSLAMRLAIAESQLDALSARYRDAVAIAAELDRLLSDALAILSSSEEEHAAIEAVRDLVLGARWAASEAAYSELMTPARRLA